MKLTERWKSRYFGKIKKEHWILLFLGGVLLLVIAMPSENRAKTADSGTEAVTADEEMTLSYGRELEERLEETLSLIDGAGRVQVMITLKNDGTDIVEKDVQNSESEEIVREEENSRTIRSDTEHQEQTVYQAEKDGEPVIRSRKVPDIEGVLVVCDGAGSPGTVSDLSDAIQALFGIEAHKIKIVKRSSVQEGTD